MRVRTMPDAGGGLGLHQQVGDAGLLQRGGQGRIVPGVGLAELFVQEDHALGAALPRPAPADASRGRPGRRACTGRARGAGSGRPGPPRGRRSRPPGCRSSARRCTDRRRPPAPPSSSMRPSSAGSSRVAPESTRGVAAAPARPPGRMRANSAGARRWNSSGGISRAALAACQRATAERSARRAWRSASRRRLALYRAMLARRASSVTVAPNCAARLAAKRLSSATR